MNARARWLPLAAIALLALMVLLNARGYLLFFDLKALDERAFDYGWEFVLPWRAVHGDWVGRDFFFPIGPGWQLIASVGSASGSVDPARFVAWMHVAFPLLSLSLVALMAWDVTRDPLARAFVCLSLGIAAIHDDVRSFRAVLSLAVIVFLLPGNLGGKRRPLIAAAAVIWSCLMGIDASVIALASVVLTQGLLALTPRRASWGQHVRRTALTLAVAGAGATLVLWALGFSAQKLWTGSWSSLRAYGTTMVRDPEGGWAYLALGIAGAQCAIALWLARRGRNTAASVAAVLLCVALVPQARGVLRSDPEHLWAGLLPGLGALVLASTMTELQRTVRWTTAAASLGVVMTWLTLDSGRMNAWSSSQWARGLGLSDHPVSPHYQSDFSRVLRYLETHPEHDCVTLPERLIALHAISGKPGPSLSAHRWSPGHASSLIDRIGSSHQRCPLVISSIRSFDLPPRHHGAAFAPARLAIARPEHLIGPNLVVATARPEPAITTRDVPMNPVDERVDVPGTLSISLRTPIASTSALSLHYELDLPNWRLALGGAPWLKAQFFTGDRPIAPATEVALLFFNGPARTWIPVHPEAAEWKFGFGRAPTAPELRASADRVVLSLHARHLSPRHMRVRVHGLREWLAPASPPVAGSCFPNQDLRKAIESGAAMSRALSPRVDGGHMLLPPNPERAALAEVFIPVRPCKDSCLYGQVGIDQDAGGDADLEVHAVDGFERPRLLRWRVRPGHAPRPFEAPLGQYAGLPILIRFGSAPVNGLRQPRAGFLRPRMARCKSLVSVVHRLQDGRMETLRGKARVSGDTLQLQPQPQRKPPTEVRVPLRLPRDSCLAVDLALEPTQAGAPQDLELGVVRGGEYVVLVKDRVSADGKERRFSDVSLEEWWDKDVELRFLARGVQDDDTWGVFARPRIHGCGDGAPWAFGPGDERGE